MYSRSVVPFGLLAAMALVPAHAGLLGTTGTLVYHYEATSTSDAFVIGSGVEFTCPDGAFNLCSKLSAPTQTVDLGDTSIHYAYSGAGSGFNDVLPNGFEFKGLNGGSPIIDFTLVSDINGLDRSRVSFTADSLQIDMHALTLAGPGRQFTVGLVFAPVPEPATTAALSAGLAVLALWRRRARSR